jgi:SAM-dependent methyltransferase
MGLLTQLQYRVLRIVAPAATTMMVQAAYTGRSKLRTLLGDALLEDVRDRDVLDFGCGEGSEAVEMAGVARSVYGLDILPQSLAVAREQAARAGVADRCTFGMTPPAHPVHVIVSLDSFEHFDDPAGVLRQMFELLTPGGQVLISFGPTWYHPLGGHLFSVFPWAHLIFSEAALIRWRHDHRSDGATRFREVEGGLNQMTIRRFERLADASGFTVEHLEAVPIRRLGWLHMRLTREFTTAIVRARMRKPH